MLIADAIAAACRDERFLRRFHSKVDTRGMNECWPWMAAKTPAGYGQIHTGSRPGRLLYAHRVAYTIARGQIPHGLHVLHHCDHPWCCNPACLFAGTDLDNVRDMDAKGRRVNAQLTGADHHAAKFTDEQVVSIRERVAGGESRRSLARKLGVSKTAISRICSRKTWRNVS